MQYRYRGNIITANTKQDAIAQIVQAARPMTIHTGLKGRNNKALLENALANMPESKTEGCEVVLEGGKVVLKVQGNNYLTKDKACFHIAKNIKRIVKKTQEWSRSNNKSVKELSDAKNKFSVKDCYLAYDILLSRETDKFSYDGGNKASKSQKSVETAKDLKAFLRQLPKCIFNDAEDYYDEDLEELEYDIKLGADFVDFEDLGLISIDLAFIKKVDGKYYIDVENRDCPISDVNRCKKLLAYEVKSRLDSLKADFDKVSKSYEKVINALK